MRSLGLLTGPPIVNSRISVALAWVLYLLPLGVAEWFHQNEDTTNLRCLFNLFELVSEPAFVFGGNLDSLRPSC